MPFDALLGQARAVSVLAAALRGGRVAHAYLFEGPEGVGRRMAALSLAQALNCEAAAQAEGPSLFGGDDGSDLRARGGCGACRACRKIAAGQHPDVQTLAPEGQSGGGVYLVDQIRGLARDLSFRPFEGRRKVAVLERAERLGPVAGNALLKTLEEPPAESHLVLLAPGRHHLLPTVASRCQVVTFRPLETADIVAILEREGVPVGPDGRFDAAAARAAAALADGSAARALALAAENGLAGRREWIERIGRLTRRRLEEVFEAAEALAADKERLPAVLDSLRAWLRDLVVTAAAPGAVPLVNGDLAESARREAAGRTIEELTAGLEAVDAAEAALRRNANRTLVVERLLLRLARP
ncbi:MAG TPA: DNA polymerase III subunit delta' [Thermodesulfobacteriota bacterium]